MASGDLTRRTAALAGLMVAGFAAPAFARMQDAPAFSSDNQQSDLLTVPVRINEQGPYTFAVDSAANASVIAEDLAVALGLADAGAVTMHTVVAGELASTVRADRVRTGALDARDARLVVAGRANMGGLDGLLGTDLLAGLRLVLHFRGRARVNVMRPRRGLRDADSLVVTARPTAGEQRFNGMLLIDAMAGSVPCKVIVDTGSRMTVINSALAVQANAQPLVLPDGSRLNRVLSPTGEGVMAEAMMLPQLQLGGVRLTRLPVLVGDFHTFSVWDLADRPALLLGVDLMGLFETVTIDLRRGELLLDP